MPLLHDGEKTNDMYSRTEKERAYNFPADAPTPAYASERVASQQTASAGRALGGPVESERTTIERLQHENANLRMRVVAVIELHLQMQSQFYTLRNSERHVTEAENEMQRLADQFSKLMKEFTQY